MLVGHGLLVYLPTPSFREAMAQFVDPDDYSRIYKVQAWGPPHARKTKPSRSELDVAHWTMFLVLIATDFEDLKHIAEARGFEACWEVHGTLDVDSGDDLINDVKALKAE